MCRKWLAYFVDGPAVGSEELIRKQLARLRGEGRDTGRKNPIRQLGGIHLSIGAGRSNAVVF
ncbi:MAG TPA: hypothetical protein ENK19_09225 [Acidobacteria bacterium]|nr:hypothetical protein [Acidobacteriota bacterium]